MPENAFGRVVEARRSAPNEMTVVERSVPTDLAEGEVLAQVQSFALTANNATYALFGEAMGYWDYFPASAPGSAITPVWGFAVITKSNHPDIQVGRQLYGFWPFAQYVTLQPKDITPYGFTDGAAHRQALHGFYNMMSFADQDAFCAGEPSLVPVLRPLFTTAWLLEEFHAQEHYFGAEQLVLTSASSKTALGTAFCVRAAGRFAGQLIGLTSKANAPFVKQTGLYDRVVTYDAIASLIKGPAAVIDFAGSAEIIAQLHEHYAGALAYSCQVGKSHSDAPFSSTPPPGPKPVLFFAPGYAQETLERMGAKAYQQAVLDRWQDYAARAHTWFDINHINTLDAAKAVFASVMDGTTKGSQAYLVHPNGA